jgi:hypothetical protein
MRLGIFPQHGGFVFGKGGALVEERVDLPVELAHAPPATQGFGVVEVECLGAAGLEQQNVMGPWQWEGFGDIR